MLELMRIRDLNRELWKGVVRELDERTGSFRGGRILATSKTDLLFFDTFEAMQQQGYSPVNPNWFVNKSIELLTPDDREDAIKIGAFVVRHLQQLDAREVLFPFEMFLENAQTLSGEELEQKAHLLLQQYDHFHDPAMHKVATELLDQAANHYAQSKNAQAMARVRKLQMRAIPPSPLAFPMDPRKWSTLEGQYIDHVGGGIVKQGSVHISTFPTLQGPVDCLSFKINHPERALLETRLACLESNPSLYDVPIRISTQPHTYLSKTDPAVTYPIGKSHQIEFGRLGKVCFGASKLFGSLYNQVEVFVEHGKDPHLFLARAHAMLTLLGMGSVFQSSSEEDEQRKKILVVFRTFFPREAFDVENDPATFFMTGHTLRRTIELRHPATAELFAHYLDHPHQMTVAEVFPGKTIYAIPDLSARMRNRGAICFLTGISAGSTPPQTAAAIGTILQFGLLSSQDRFNRGLFIVGASSKEDHGANSADQVFLRLLTRRAMRSETPLSAFPLIGKVQLLVNLDIIERGAYMFASDNNGEKNRNKGLEIQKFKERLNPLEFTSYIEETRRDENEVMIKNRIPPSYIQKILVPNAEFKKLIIQTMNEKFPWNATYNGIPFSDFVIITDHLTENLV